MKTRFGKSALWAGLIFLIFLQTLMAQISTAKSPNPKFEALIRRSDIFGYNPFKEIEGNPYFEKEFQTGEIIHKDSSVTRDVLMRLNHYSDQIEFKYKNSIMIFTQPRDIDHVTFGHKSFVFSDYSTGKKNKSGFFEVLAWGNCKLFLRRASIIKREKLPPTELKGGNFRDYFRTTEEYYLKKGDLPAIKIQKTKKSILKALSDHETELIDFIEKRELKLKKDEDLIDLIYHYNAISQSIQ